MNHSQARRYIVSAKGDAAVAAWVSVIDQYKLPLHHNVPPDEWYQAYEELYLSDAIDPDVFAMCNVKRTFYRGNTPHNKDVETAFWNLKYLRSQSHIEDFDEEAYVNRRYSDEPLPDADDLFASPDDRGMALTAPTGGQRGMQLMDDGFGVPSELPTRIDHELMGPMIERTTALDVPMQAPRIGSGHDIRSLECTDPDPTGPTTPYREAFNFGLRCCGEEVYLEDTGGSEWYEGEDIDDHDTVDLQLHGTCPSCATSFHMGASMPTPKGTGRDGFYG